MDWGAQAHTPCPGRHGESGTCVARRSCGGSWPRRLCFGAGRSRSLRGGKTVGVGNCPSPNKFVAPTVGRTSARWPAAHIPFRWPRWEVCASFKRVLHVTANCEMVFKLATRAMRSLNWLLRLQHFSKDHATELQMKIATRGLHLQTSSCARVLPS